MKKKALVSLLALTLAITNLTACTVNLPWEEKESKEEKDIGRDRDEDKEEDEKEEEEKTSKKSKKDKKKKENIEDYIIEDDVETETREIDEPWDLEEDGDATHYFEDDAEPETGTAPDVTVNNDDNSVLTGSKVREIFTNGISGTKYTTDWVIGIYSDDGSTVLNSLNLQSSLTPNDEILGTGTTINKIYEAFRIHARKSNNNIDNFPLQAYCDWTSLMLMDPDTDRTGAVKETLAAGGALLYTMHNVQDMRILGAYIDKGDIWLYVTSGDVSDIMRLVDTDNGVEVYANEGTDHITTITEDDLAICYGLILDTYSK